MQSLTPCSVGFSRTPYVHHAHYLWPIGTRSDAASQLLPGQNALSAGAQHVGGRGIKFAPVARDYCPSMDPAASVGSIGGRRVRFAAQRAVEIRDRDQPLYNISNVSRAQRCASA